MADKLVDPVIGKFIDFVFEYLKDKVIWPKGMEEELESLRQKRPKIQAIINYASSQEQIKDPALNKWLWQLRDAIDEADDVMDEFEYQKLKEQMEKSKKRKNVMSFPYESANKFLRRGADCFRRNDPTLNRVEEVVHKLDKVSADVATFLNLVDKAKEGHQGQQHEHYRSLETGSMCKGTALIGRDDEKEYVIKWLRKTSNEDQTSNFSPTNFYSNISLLSVVGQGGMGKTTLLQHVCKEVEKTESDENKFDLKMWVCVPINCNQNYVIAYMLESATKKSSSKRLEAIQQDFMSASKRLDALQQDLMSEVLSKKFLLVLDDIWEEDDEDLNESRWENVLAPLAYGKLGSKILVTTRMESVAVMLSKIIKKENEMLRLKGLKDDDCLLLFNKHAFADVKDLHAFPNLRPISKKIAEKLCGSPLAARIIGDTLSSTLDEPSWESFLNCEIGAYKSIMRNLKLSYVFLPNDLQNCLSFCCTFPSDDMPHKDDLVRMWTALGFIQLPTNSRETMTDVGERYYDTLVKKSIFDKFQTNYRTCHKMHDLLYQMLRAVSAQQCFSIVNDDELQIPETIRHLSVKTRHPNVLKEVEKIKNLRSIILFVSVDHEDFVGALTTIFKRLKSIRLIYIDASNLKQMPNEIGDLMHLRYLKIFNISTLTLLPISLSNLYNLQFMICNHYCGNLRVDAISPNDINTLLNLNYLEVPFPGMYEIGKLNSLKELHGFYVQNKDGYRIEELQYMKELRVLKINFGENLNIADSANLCKNKDLIDLSLRWDHNRSNAVAALDENVLDNLQPQRLLKKLEIINYMGARPATWMNDLFSNLQRIHLENCCKWRTIPPFWQLPALIYLYLYNMPEVKGFDYTFHGNAKVGVFPSLQVLHIERLEALEKLFVATEAEAAAYEFLFPCLKELSLFCCPKLPKLPTAHLPPKLEKLVIDPNEWKDSNWLQGIKKYGRISILHRSNLIAPT